MAVCKSNFASVTKPIIDMKQSITLSGREHAPRNINIYGHTTPSRVQVWLRRHRGLICLYGIGAIVILLQLRSIL